MPQMYESIRDRLESGPHPKSPQAAKSEAAAIFNARAKKQGTPYLNAYVARERKSGPMGQFRHG